MDGPVIVGLHITALIDRLAEHVEYATQNVFADRHRNRLASIDTLEATTQTIGATQSNTAHAIAAEMLLDLTGQVNVDTFFGRLDLYRVINRGQMAVGKFCVKRRADNLRDSAHIGCCGSRHRVNPQRLFLNLVVFGCRGCVTQRVARDCLNVSF